MKTHIIYDTYGRPDGEVERVIDGVRAVALTKEAALKHKKADEQAVPIMMATGELDPKKHKERSLTGKRCYSEAAYTKKKLIYVIIKKQGRDSLLFAQKIRMAGTLPEIKTVFYGVDYFKTKSVTLFR